MGARQSLERKALNDAIAACSGKRVIRRAFQVWPNLQLACLRLSSYLLDVVPGDSKPLLYECISRLAEAFRAAKDSGVESDLTTLIGCMNAVLDPIPKLRRTKVIVRKRSGEPVAWQPFVTSLKDFKDQHPKSRLEVVADEDPVTSDEVLRFALAARIFNVNDLSALAPQRAAA